MVVVRTMAIRGRFDGLLHHERDEESRAGRFGKQQTTIQPKVTMRSGDHVYIETLLPVGDAARDLYTVTGHQDLMVKRAGSWRINFILDQAGKEQFLLTLQDETNSLMLCTVEIPEAADRGLLPVITPLQRYLNQQQNGVKAPGLWGALLSDEF